MAERLIGVLGLLTVLWYSIGAVEPEILQSPANVTVGLNQGSVTLTCLVRGENLFIRVDGMLYGHNSIDKFMRRGITLSNENNTHGEIHQSVTVPATEINNNTVIVCYATDRDHDTVSSDEATIFIAGAPSTPAVQYSALDEHTLQVFWEEPFAHEDFPIIDYFVRVTNATDQEFLSRMLHPDTRTVNVAHEDPIPCINLTFSVVARNSVGRSQPGIIYGAFPFRPGEFPESPSSEVTFGQDTSLILEVNFTFPSLCPYNDANYSLVILDERAMIVHDEGPYTRHWLDQESLVTIDMRETELHRNAHYSANIRVWNLAGQASTSFTFNTYLQITLDPPHTDQVIVDNTINPGYIAAACIGTILVMLILSGLFVSIVYIHQRRVKRNRACVHTTELADHVRRGMPMVVNPIYEGGAIYEEIPDPSHFKSHAAEPTGLEREEGYVSISATNPMCNTDGYCKKQDEVYTSMNSVGTLLGHLGGGAAALGSPEQVPTLYSNVSNEDGASAQCGWQMPKDTDPEGRYVIVN